MLFVLIICTFTYPTTHTLSKMFVGLILTFALLVVVITIVRFRKPMQYNGVFLKIATKFVEEHRFILINIPIFIVLFVFFEYIIVLELNSIWTSGNL
jgi:hypothetical protein